MITVKMPEEIRILREGGRRLARILQNVVSAARVGVTTLDLDRLAESLIFESGGNPSFKGYHTRHDTKPFPSTLCISINDEVVHGIPRRDRVLQEGDVVGIDIGMLWPAEVSTKAAGGRRGLFTDMAVTIGIGKISKEAEQLLCGTKEALDVGIAAVRHGVRVGDVSYAIQHHLEKYGFGIIRDLAGHGVGYQVHEDPLIPNFGKQGTGPELKEGMVVALEPMATLGTWQVRLADDGWTYKTKDGSMGAHFEHTMAVVRDGVEILTVI